MKDPTVIFEEDTHSYWHGSGPLRSDTRTKMVSGTTFIGQFTKPFNRAEIIARCAMAEIVGPQFWSMFFANEDVMATEDELLDFFHYKISEDHYLERKITIREEWDLGNRRGTALHQEIEEDLYAAGFAKHPFIDIEVPVVKFPKKYDNQSIVKDLSSLEDGAYPELVVWHDDALLAGQADFPIIYTDPKTEERCVIIIDFKTNGGYNPNKGLKKREELTKPTYAKTFMKDPISHLYDCTYSKYQLQLSLYGHLLELHGFKPQPPVVKHFLNYDKEDFEYIKYPYIGKECESIVATLLED